MGGGLSGGGDGALQAQAGPGRVLLCAAAARMAPLGEPGSWLSEGLLHTSPMTSRSCPGPEEWSLAHSRCSTETHFFLPVLLVAGAPLPSWEGVSGSVASCTGAHLWHEAAEPLRCDRSGLCPHAEPGFLLCKPNMLTLRTREGVRV